jgi:hypothetical protein
MRQERIIVSEDRQNEGPAAAENESSIGAVLAPQYGVGPFSVREVALAGVWLVAFVVSFFSVASQQTMGQLVFGGSVWSNGIDWILTIGVPTIAVFLIVLRRFSPGGIRRVGSLGIDQFASVAFSVSAVVWLGLLWRNIAIAIESNVWLYGWVVWLEFFVMLAGVVLTVFAPLIPAIGDDFVGRPDAPAHRYARPARVIAARPVSATPVAPVAEPVDFGAESLEGPDVETSDIAPAHAAGAATSDETWSATDAFDGPDAASGEPAYAETQVFDTTETAGQPVPRAQAFWALAPEDREILDESGTPIFRVGPSAWALVLEDRGEVFVVRHEDGRIGYLHDVSGVTRG